MTIDYNKLSELQVVLSDIFKVEDLIKEIPKNLKDQEEVLNKLKIDYIELTENLKKLQQEYEEINAEYLEMGKKKEELESNINQTVLVRETESMNKEIDSAKLNEQNLYKSRNAKQIKITELEEKLSIQEQILKSQEEEVAKEIAENDSLIEEQNKILNGLIIKRDKLSEDLSPNLLFKFERIIRNKNGIGVVPLHGIICQGCFMELPRQFANIVRKNENINFCPYCSRILFYEPSEEDDSDVLKQVFGDIHSDENEEEIDTSHTDSNIFEGERLIED